MKFLWIRLPKRGFIIALTVGVVLAGLQLFQLFGPISPNDSPYTRWLSIDPFNLFPIIFFIILPLIASMPAGTLLKSDLDSGFLAKIQLKSSLLKIMGGYATFSFIMGFIVVIIPLLINLLIYFMFLPNIRPDNLLNSNLLLTTENVLFVNVYYTHPFIHAILSIAFASFWGGLFAVFVSTTSLWINNRFVALSTGLVLQIAILMCNSFIKLPNFISYSPADFLHEMAPTTNISLGVTSFVTVIMLGYCITMLMLGGKRLAP